MSEENVEIVRKAFDTFNAFGRGELIAEDVVFHLWTVRDGKVRKIELFRHRADALEAAGLRK